MNMFSGYASTENGALAHTTSKSAVLDFFSLAGGMRGGSAKVNRLLEKALAEDETLALRALAHLRDIRAGAGERELFREALVWLSSNNMKAFRRIVVHVPEYGRWDDMIDILPNVNDEALSVIADLITEEIKQFRETGKATLLGKWLPSDNAGKASKELAKIVKSFLGMKYGGEYRKLLTRMRAASYIVERDMSANAWDKIPYKHVASRAAMIYSDAFIKHDEGRYIAALSDVKATTLMPYELYNRRNKMRPEVLNATWRALPDFMNGRNALVLADVSGSMSGDPMSVSVSLALYAAERTKGAFRGTFLTFESNPRIMHVSPENDPKTNMGIIERAPWGGSTNVHAAFELILGIAKRDRVPEADMPEVLFIISDMQFDPRSYTQTNHEQIQSAYAEAGYRRPVLVYWNVKARLQTPVTKDSLGAIMVSGLSATAFKNVLNLDFKSIEEEEGASITPMEAMLQILNGERYSRI